MPSVTKPWVGFWGIAPGVIWFVASVGCGEAAPPTVLVSGTVAYDGEPVADGSVTFVSPDGSAVPGVLIVRDGRYEGRVVAGQKRIEVRGMRPARGPAAAAGGPGSDEGGLLENYIPASYNDTSTLLRMLDSPGPHVVDLDLPAVR